MKKKPWKPLPDLTGKKFGKLSVIKKIPKYKYLCICDCGTKKEISASNLACNQTKSCGCLRKQSCGNNFRTHGKSKSPEHIAWLAMKNRCYTKKHISYPNYGGRGIKVCKRWKNSFENFLADMGKKPSPKHSLDRKDFNKNYSPDNCQWSTRKKQNSNTRTNFLITYCGMTKTLIQWARIYELNRGTLSIRLKSGMSFEQAISIPKRKGRYSSKKKK